MNILIKNIDVVTADPSNMVIENANIAIKDGKIFKITHNEQDLIDFKADKTISGKNRIAMPGLVNAHTHTPMTLLRNYADDLSLEDWLYKHIFPIESKLNEEDVYNGSMLAIAEMIKSGTTSFADMYFFVDQTCKAVANSGIKANISKSAYSFEFDNGKFIFTDVTKDFERFKSTWHNSSDGRIKTSVSVHSPYIYDSISMRDSAEFAKHMDTGIHIHILETEKERKDTFEKYGKSAVEACMESKVFDVPVFAAHCVHLNDKDIEILKNKNVSIVHNPTSNLKLGSGIARIPDMQKSSVNIALGTDGTASNNNLNLFEEMHITALIHKGLAMNPVLVNASETILMATANGARAIGFNDTGVLKEGYKADIILIDTDKLHLCPNNNPISAIVYSMQASDVDTVIIDGNIIMENCELKTIDEEKIKAEVRKTVKRIYPIPTSANTPPES